MDRREKKICLCRKQFKHKRGLHDCGCPCHSWSKELKVNVDRREELAEVIDKSFMCWIQDSAKSGDKIFFDCRKNLTDAIFSWLSEHYEEKK
jgi:hypothetical protein